MQTNLSINETRLWDSLMDIAQFGLTPKGGCRRLALTDTDKAGRDQFVKWCEEAGCTVSVDAMGNLFARRPGKNNDLPPIVLGSHLDTQPSGGKFDGVFGVMAALEVIRTLKDLNYTTEAPIEVAVWTNEEGSRFAPAMIASGVFAGVFDLEYGLSRADLDGATIGDELKRIGYDGKDACGGRKLGAYFEAHIEQGPILDIEEKTVGVVTDVQGMRWYEATIKGQDAHTGATPMYMRKDALCGLAEMVLEIERIGKQFHPIGVGSVGLVQVKPNSRNVVPGEVFFTIDFRHPDATVMDQMDVEMRAAVAKIAEARKLELDLKEIWYSAPVHFDESCVAAVRKGVEELGYSHRDMVSGAGHDACYLARVTPTSMIFIPCVGGLSHNEEEDIRREWAAAGCNVLLRAAVEKANGHS
jgi:beta-ureidopropionase / N-carbamoyl-L-amino-acid hydrolase